MALSDRKLEQSDFVGYEVSSLPDRPELSPDALKQRFDASMEEVMVPAFNGLIDDLLATTDSASGADNIGCTAVGEGTAETVQGVLEELNTAMPDTAAIESSISTGWYSSPSVWTYASATTVTVPSGAVDLYDIGDKFKLTANSVELQGYIVTVADTLLTVKGDALTDHEFSGVYVSKSENPHGFDDWFDYVPNLTGGAADFAGYDVAQYRIKGKTLEYKFRALDKAVGGSSGLSRISLPINTTEGSTCWGNAKWFNGSNYIPCRANLQTSYIEVSGDMTLGNITTGAGRFLIIDGSYPIA